MYAGWNQMWQETGFAAHAAQHSLVLQPTTWHQIQAATN
jgi:hypothetical protein